MKRSSAAAVAVLALGLLVPVSGHAAARVLRVGDFEFSKYVNPECGGANTPVGTFAGFAANQCAVATFVVDAGGTSTNGVAPAPNPTPQLSVRFLDETGATVFTQDVTPPASGSDTWSFQIHPSDWTDPRPGNIRFVVESKVPTDTLQGQPSFQFQYNQLGTRTILDTPSYATTAGGLPAADLVVHGVTWEKYTKAEFIGSDPTDPTPNPDLVPADVTVELTKKAGAVVSKATTSGTDGAFSVTFTAAEIGDVSATSAQDFRTPIKIHSTATYDDPTTGTWRSASVDTERDAYAVFETKPDRAQVRSQFVSERGWVAPGEEYIHAVEYRNVSGAPATGVAITDVLPDTVTFVSAAPAPDGVNGNTLTWDVGTVTSGTQWPSGASAGNRILVTARAKTTAQDPTILYQDASDTATIAQTGAPDAASTSNGPHITTQDTARYGDRPFPVVLVEFTDFKHSPATNGWTFYNRISSHENPSSLWSHYQHMSFGQLNPSGELASLEATDTTFASGGPYKWSNPYLSGDTCTGVSTVPPDPTGPPAVAFTPAGNRIVDGWYQLPAQRQYYGQDGKGSAIVGAEVGVGPLQDIDAGCGPTGKSAYDAASISDPDIDYNDFDSDRNCVVDFFEVVFEGRGGNGDSQVHGYDNIWPHSGNLQDAFIDANGQAGYVSNDQCRDRLERPLWWTDSSRTKLTTTNTGDALKAYTRVGPYNVNPENGTTSVFAHEYGHSLGLPDFYSTGSRNTVEYWELMAQDAFQYMSVFSRQDLGWIIPKRTPPSLTATLQESKVDTHRIDAIGANGLPYTLSGPNVHNGDAYYVELPHRELLKNVSLPSGTHAWYSAAGNGFGCPGHTLDVDLRTARFAPSGTALTLSFKSWYEAEWDFDYGFVMISTDHGKTFQSVASNSGTTTPSTFNPNANACEQKYSNGITGTSSATNFPQNVPDRETGNYPEPTFINDSYDISACAGKDCIVRFAYSTDTGVAKRGWVIDDLKVAGSDGKTYFNDDVEKPDLGAYGSNGWIRFAVGPSTFDHGYYLELRDRVSNDFDSSGEGERAPITWIPGVSLWYTDEAHGYGNFGTDDPPAQNPLDARAEPQQDVPRLADAAFFPLAGINHFDDTKWTDNYLNETGGNWTFAYKCFSMTVNSISGLGTLGDATASVTMTTNPANCLRVLAISQGIPKPAKLPATEAELPATGDTRTPAIVGLFALIAAAILYRRSRTV